MKKQLLLSVAVAALAAGQPASANVTGEIITGYDSNPFKFNDSLPIDGSEFLNGKVKYDYRTPGGIGFVATGDMFLFGSGASDANKFKISGAADYKIKGHFLDKKTKYILRLKYTNEDKTYVSRTTGLPGAFGGSSSEDRYDTQSYDVRARMDIALDKKVRLRLSMDGRDKSYKDYGALGLSNLDYVQWIASSKLRFRPDPRNELTGAVSYAVREYDDREGKTLTGVTVPDFNLEYTNTEFDAGWKHSFTKGHSIRAFYAYKAREDNVFGYYDTSTNEYGLKYQNALSDRKILTAGVKFTDYSYDNGIVVGDLENDEPIGSKDGYKVSASYAHALSPEKDPRWWVTAKVSYEDYDSVDAIYVYDKTVAKVGFRAKF